jgi:hypothetical protein
MIDSAHLIRDDSAGINHTRLLSALRELVSPHGTGMVAVHLRAQNAGITVTRSEDAALIEAFELLLSIKQYSKPKVDCGAIFRPAQS